ncbi:ATPase [Haematobacter missouriensis]|uniref:ATPase n=1 Tax=Haematobacter missouriensis TaxID=366616 RepID=A0A212APL3_9RHOB|nr:ATP12 family protein [Haematobacter missouriensis]KFI27593.1 ATPase [Haematobacter missouriensis]OWJ76019.1 ATPase [Haematobacter missouriensis]OWJ83409.1 ATPase [Haematobacter missouriensis]
MSEWRPKRFWKATSVLAEGNDYGVALDGRPLRTPARQPLRVRSRALAEALAAEWEAQQEHVAPETMPLTRMANSAIDKVTGQRDAVAEIVGDYGGTDLLAYRAEAPAELVARQADRWDPLLLWAGEALAAPLSVTTGVMFKAQPPATLAQLEARVATFDPFELTALHDLVALSGSLILGLAVAEGRLAPEEAWDLSRLDEDWQAEIWGRDEQAEAQAAQRRTDFLDAARFMSLYRRAD